MRGSTFKSGKMFRVNVQEFVRKKDMASRISVLVPPDKPRRWGNFKVNYAQRVLFIGTCERLMDDGQLAIALEAVNFPPKERAMGVAAAHPASLPGPSTSPPSKRRRMDELDELDAVDPLDSMTQATMSTPSQSPGAGPSFHFRIGRFAQVRPALLPSAPAEPMPIPADATALDMLRDGDFDWDTKLREVFLTMSLGIRANCVPVKLVTEEYKKNFEFPLVNFALMAIEPVDMCTAHVITLSH
ncbi:uncharacterized protein BXZ73DRAFT_104848 [Epithele typhae]|uniref:uncharacterized protein n=1 Tax=Epithele typhae TaxID=378194 RepID=UPI002008791A|nr:uncharacterized protein BXZ73DRAFT_104848 [Epithele typhae]KAH9920034.1 hypothetical protein BXZ73DRAFT_104848 [Epithele typhae]